MNWGGVGGGLPTALIAPTSHELRSTTPAPPYLELIGEGESFHKGTMAVYMMEQSSLHGIRDLK